jgi:O-acetyl-ADP-ribose deacetylase (regulator of RNase III)
VHSIAFPAISTGIYGFPLERATEIAIREVRAFLQNDATLGKVVFVCFDEDTYRCYARVLTEAV